METMQKITKKCCVCGRIKQESGWQHGGDDREALYSHGYCPRCEREAAMELGRRIMRAHAIAHLPYCASAA